VEGTTSGDMTVNAAVFAAAFRKFRRVFFMRDGGKGIASQSQNGYDSEIVEFLNLFVKVLW
jgi:hypothetical protein